MEDKIEIREIGENVSLKLAYLESSVPAGFPSPAQDSNGDSLDLNRELISNPSSTYCARVTGDSMIDCNICDGDLLIIDKSISPYDGSIAVCFLDGEFTVKRLSIEDNGVILVPANNYYPSIKVSEESNFQIWGIVTHIIKKV
jgi:DNA polymerase V